MNTNLHHETGGWEPDSGCYGYIPVADVMRGDAAESVHFGAVAVVDTAGRLVAHAGDPESVTYTRSALKPFQAMSFVAQGGHRKFELTVPEVAVMCASHSGEDIHEEAVRSILKKIGRDEADLMCGSHVPLSFKTDAKLAIDKSHFSPVLNNCSGKHAGMLAFCKLMGVDHGDYLGFDHPIQRRIKETVSYFTGVAPEDMTTGIDGCSAPNFAMPLSGLARAFAKLAIDAADPEYGEAPQAIFAAMTRNPRMVAGTGRGDLAIMQTGGGDWVSKVGGEAVEGIGVRSRGLGIAVKVADGHPRVLLPVVVEVLRQLELADDLTGTPLAEHVNPKVTNHRDIETGYIRPRFTLTRVALKAATGGN